MKSYFVDKGIPIIINEVGVLTEEKKEIESIREYLYVLFSIASEYDQSCAVYGILQINYLEI